MLLCLAGCATAPAAPDSGPAIARITPEELARLTPKPEAKLSTGELVRMSKDGATTDAIIARIKETGSRYDLGAAQLIELHAQGLSAEVLDYIQAARAQELRDRAAEEINQRERRHAEELQREQQLRRDSIYYYDPWRPAYPGYGPNYGPPFRFYGGYYWRR